MIDLILRVVCVCLCVMLEYCGYTTKPIQLVYGVRVMVPQKTASDENSYLTTEGRTSSPGVNCWIFSSHYATVSHPSNCWALICLLVQILPHLVSGSGNLPAFNEVWECTSIVTFCTHPSDAADVPHKKAEFVLKHGSYFGWTPFGRHQTNMSDNRNHVHWSVAFCLNRRVNGADHDKTKLTRMWVNAQRDGW